VCTAAEVIVVCGTRTPLIIAAIQATVEYWLLGYQIFVSTATISLRKKGRDGKDILAEVRHFMKVR